MMILYLIRIEPTEASTPPKPSRVSIASSNSTSVNLIWTPPTATPLPIVNYTIKYIANDGTERTIVLPHTQSSHRIGGLSPGFSYTFRIQAVYSDGTSSDPVRVTMTLTEEDSSILSQPWFYAAVAGGGALFLIIACVLVICICYQCCKIGRYNGMPHPQLGTSANRACGCNLVITELCVCTFQFATHTATGNSWLP